MTSRIIEYSINNRWMVLAITAVLLLAGVYAAREIAIDAIPDLSDVQVIVQTEYPGQPPQVVEDQVTYPLSTALLAVPKAKNVRGFSYFGLSFVYVIFEDGMVADVFASEIVMGGVHNIPIIRSEETPVYKPGVSCDFMGTGADCIGPNGFAVQSHTFDLFQVKDCRQGVTALPHN